MHPLEALYTLQEVEGELQRIHDGSAVSQERAELHDVEEKLAAQREKRERAAADLASLERRLRRLELDLQSVETEIESFERKLFSGEVQHPKELKGLQDRVDAGKEQKSRLEDEILSCLDALEKARALCEKAEKRLDSLDRRRGELGARLKQAVAQWNAKRTELEQDRERLLRAVPPDLVTRYRSLYDRLGGRPVARVENRTCLGCRVELPMSMRPPKEPEISRCPRCGRLLWWPHSS